VFNCLIMAAIQVLYIAINRTTFTTESEQ